MKTLLTVVLSTVAAMMLTVTATTAAVVESLESDQGSVAMQKLDTYLGQQVVATRLAQLGLSKADVTAKLATLSEPELERLAGQVDLLQAGGMIQGGNPHPWGVIGCIFEPMGRFFHDVFQLLFCWGPLSTD
jgi:hypothetical protein